MEEKSVEFKSSSSSPLFSTIITICILILLYFPAHFLEIIFSPVLIFTGILLLCILRLAAIQRTQKEFNSIQLPLQQQEQEQLFHDYNYDNHIWDSCDTNSGSGYDPNPFYADSFVEWNVRAPLEIIYEAYEGEEEDDIDDRNGDVSIEKQEKAVPGIERYPSLSLYYPESDTDSSSDGDFAVIGNWDSPERMGFLWEEEARDGIIEIALDGKRRSQFLNVEEENLIEIDISPARNDTVPASVRYIYP